MMKIKCCSLRVMKKSIKLRSCRKNLLGICVADLLTQSLVVSQGNEMETIMHVEKPETTKGGRDIGTLDSCVEG